MNDYPEQIDELLELLASKERRRLIEYFVRNGTDAETMEVLSAYLTRLAVEGNGDGDLSTDVLQTRLHHVHLPKLEEHAVVEYDQRVGEVRYRENERIERIVALLDDV